MPFNLGIWRQSGGVAVSYLDGVIVETLAHPVRTGSTTHVVALDTNGFHVDRIEWRDAPGGTLLDSFDWNSTAGWTATNGGGSITPAGYLDLLGGATSQGYYITQPVGTNFVELIGCYFDASATPHWGMVSFWQENPGQDYGETGYRVLRRVNSGQVQIVDGYPLVGGIIIGSVGLR